MQDSRLCLRNEECSAVAQSCGCATARLFIMYRVHKSGSKHTYMGWTARRSNPDGGEICHTVYNGVPGLFPGGKAARAWRLSPTPI